MNDHCFNVLGWMRAVGWCQKMRMRENLSFFSPPKLCIKFRIQYKNRTQICPKSDMSLHKIIISNSYVMNVWLPKSAHYVGSSTLLCSSYVVSIRIQWISSLWIALYFISNASICITHESVCDEQESFTIHPVLLFLLLLGLLFLLVQVNVRRLHPNDGLVEQPEGLFDMFGLHLNEAETVWDRCIVGQSAPLGWKGVVWDVATPSPPRHSSASGPCSQTDGSCSPAGARWSSRLIWSRRSRLSVSSACTAPRWNPPTL